MYRVKIILHDWSTSFCKYLEAKRQGIRKPFDWYVKQTDWCIKKFGPINTSWYVKEKHNYCCFYCFKNKEDAMLFKATW